MAALDSPLLAAASLRPLWPAARIGGGFASRAGAGAGSPHDDGRGPTFSIACHLVLRAPGLAPEPDPSLLPLLVSSRLSPDLSPDHHISPCLSLPPTSSSLRLLSGPREPSSCQTIPTPSLPRPGSACLPKPREPTADPFPSGMPYTSRCSSTASSSLSPEPQTPAPPIVVKPRRPSATRRPSLPKAARPAAAQVLGPPPPSPPLTAGASGSNDGSRSPPVRNSPPRARKPTKRKEAPVASSTTGVETVKRGKTTHACEACRRAKDKVRRARARFLPFLPRACRLLPRASISRRLGEQRGAT